MTCSLFKSRLPPRRLQLIVENISLFHLAMSFPYSVVLFQSSEPLDATTARRSREVREALDSRHEQSSTRNLKLEAPGDSTSQQLAMNDPNGFAALQRECDSRNSLRGRPRQKKK